MPTLPDVVTPEMPGSLRHVAIAADRVAWRKNTHGFVRSSDGGTYVRCLAAKHGLMLQLKAARKTDRFGGISNVLLFAACDIFQHARRM